MLFWQSCFGSLVLAVLSWSSCPDRAVLAVLSCCMFCLSRSAHLVLAWLAVLLWLSCPVILFWQSCSVYPVPILPIILCLSSSHCPVLLGPFCLSHPACLVLSELSYLGCPTRGVLSWPFCLCSDYRDLAVLSWLSSSGVPFSACPVLPVPVCLSRSSCHFPLLHSSCSVRLSFSGCAIAKGTEIAKVKARKWRSSGARILRLKRPREVPPKRAGTQTRKEKSARLAIVRVCLRIFWLLKWDKPMLFYAFVRDADERTLKYPDFVFYCPFSLILMGISLNLCTGKK